MTIKEAIKRVQAMITYMETIDATEEEEKDLEAYRMSVKALKQEPILDKIRAEIEKAIWEDILPISDETGEITDEIRIPLLDPDDVFEIIDKYKADERSVKSEDDL